MQEVINKSKNTGLLYDLNGKVIKRPEGILLLSDFKKTTKPIKKISTASLWNIGDEITVFEIHSKGNSIDIATMGFLDESIDLVSSSYKAMIIYNEGDFSFGLKLLCVRAWISKSLFLNFISIFFSKL